jgi:1-aminocyclopropane-1-carboxylate deaminase
MQISDTGIMQKIVIEPVSSITFEGIQTDTLRLDRLHPVVSGNKWFKLQHYLADALEQGIQTVASFGGAYSNHIVAIAFAAKEAGLNSIGYIRGEAASNPTLEEAKAYGMTLHFVDRVTYRDKENFMQQHKADAVYWIAEGGYGIKGAEGAAGILFTADTSHYTHILCAVGTGTMLAGLIKAAKPGQRVLGIKVLKHADLETEVRVLLTEPEQRKSFGLKQDYHFGGYGKHPQELLDFMGELWKKDGIPTDIVYTSKLFFAARDLVQKGAFPKGSKLLLIHSGGLQGNRSLPAGVLPF